MKLLNVPRPRVTDTGTGIVAEGAVLGPDRGYRGELCALSMSLAC